jgi:hypothetical protein
MPDRANLNPRLKAVEQHAPIADPQATGWLLTDQRQNRVARMIRFRRIGFNPFHDA